MNSYLLKRFIQALVSLFIITLLVFVMMYSVGDPIAVLLPPNAPAQSRERLRVELGLDKPLVVQYGVFMSRLSRGDFGTSYTHGRPVAEVVAERAPATIELACVALMVSLAIGLPLGLYAGARPKSLISRAVISGSILGISLPTFWIGLLLLMYFGVHLGWLPTMGRGPTRPIGGVEWSFLSVSGWRHLILPSVTLSLHHTAMLLRLTQSEMIQTLRKPFIQVARSHGLSEASVVGRHALRNTMIPIVTVVGVEFGQLLAFSVITETIFQWPGLGKLLIDAIYLVDRPLIVAYLIMTGALFLTINFLVDLTYAVFDPRIRISAAQTGLS